ncbi:MAG: hypothetical protein J5651_00240 [Salinivirgaceae bacterium]|nr:hypothetical protein [Salinivirgaceae bacterium]
MKKTFQIIEDITVAAHGNKTLREQMLADYEHVTGVMIVPHNLSDDISGLNLSCRISQKEVLPSGTDAVLISYNGNCARKDCIYDFKADKIPARSSNAELVLYNSSEKDVKFNFYFILENESE